MTTHLHKSADTGTAFYILRSGRSDCQVWFYPSLYQLKLVQDGREQVIDLGFAGSRVLERLLREPGKLVSREDLLEHGWPERVVSQGSLNQQVHTLRQHLSDDQGLGIIQTIPRRGYMFNLAYFAGIFQEEQTGLPTSAGAAIAPPASLLQRAAGQRRWTAAAIAGVSGLLFGLAALIYSAAGLSQFKLISTEVNGGKAYILYVNYKPEQQAQDLVMRRNLEDLAAFDYAE